jgi:hypothetical protein
MSKFSLRFSLAILACVLLVGTAFVKADDLDKSNKEKNRLQKGAGTPRYGVLNINNLWSWHRSDGLSNHSPASDNGLYYPRFTSWAIYQDGVLWGGKVYRDAALTQPGPFQQLIRVGGAHYATGTANGRITGSDATAVAQNPNDADARMYRIRRDYASMSDENLRADAAINNEIPIAQVTDAQVQAVKDQYDKDWKEWPVSIGAPFVDRNGNGVYDAPPAFSATFTVDSLITQGRDEPGVAGADPNSPADQVLWTVMNDLNRALTTALARVRSEPLGLEVQKTLWGYNRSDAMGNLYFQRYKFINKGGVDIDGSGTKGSFYIDSMYVTQWSDPDLGGAGDDLLGCDTVLSMGFVYNGLAIDLEYQKYNLPPPSSAYDFLAGPIVPAPGETAVFDLKYREGYRNLPMTGFSYFSAGSNFTDPPDSYTQGTIRWYKMMRGFVPLDGADAFYPHPPGVTVGRFPLAGDPVAGTGHLDGEGTSYSFSPGDRRLLLNTGPFTMAPGDTQEIVIGVVVGLGSDRISSVAVMKFNDRFAQNTYDALFAVPKSPLAPDVKIAELDGEVVLEWGSNAQRIIDIEQRVNEPGQYEFEGYNVYQLASRGSSLNDASTKRIATFDLPDDPAVVLDEQFDQASGLVLFKPVQFGTNSGITRRFKLDKDYVRDLEKLFNGQEYYVAVTAYTVAKQAGFLPAQLESSPTVYTVRPQVPFGKTLKIGALDTVQVTHVGGSDGVVAPIVVNPLLLTGDTYRVTFAADPDDAASFLWTMTNTTKNQVILADQSHQLDDELHAVVNGMLLKVIGPPVAINNYTFTGGTRWLTGVNWGGAQFFGGLDVGANFFGSNITPDKYVTVEVRFQATPTGQNAYRYVRGGTPSYGYVDYIPQYFTVWDVTSNPERQLAAAYVTQAGTATEAGPWQTTGSNADRMYLFIFGTDYTATPDPYFTSRNALNQAEEFPSLYALWPINRGGTGGFADIADGQVFKITPNFANTTADVFTFTAPAPESGQDVEKTAAEQVGVFPNPYYGFNPAETSRFSKFVTFNSLPKKATIRIFNLAGQLVRTVEKDDDGQFIRWNLLNQHNFPVASGMYIAHVDMPDLGMAKTLKIAIIQEQEVLDVY